MIAEFFTNSNRRKIIPFVKIIGLKVYYELNGLGEPLLPIAGIGFLSQWMMV
jgi:hypothetical protein